jgi:hypothetical protein
MATVKTHIPGTSISIGYESETADRATIRCLVTDCTAQKDAIDAAVLAVGQTLYSGILNIPLVSAESTRWGNGKYIVTLLYGRNQRAQRRNQTQRRVRIQSTIEYVDAYLINSASFTNGYRHNSDPATADWFSIQLRPGNLQSPELYPRPYKIQRPMMKIELEYTTPFLSVNDAELAKTGKVNSNVFAIGEIGGVFAANTLKYEGFQNAKNDIGQYPWFNSVVLTYDPFGHYRQQVVWDQTLDSGNGKWKTISNYLVSETTTF